MTPVTIGNRKGLAVYMDDQWTPVAAEHASLAKVLFDDGGSAFYRVSQKRAAEFNPEQARDEHGRWTDTGGGSLSDEDKAIIGVDWAWPDQPNRMDYQSMRDPKTAEGKRMTEILEKLPVHDGTTYRGLVLTADDVQRLINARGYEMHLHSSTSKNNETALLFADAGSFDDDDIPVILEMQGRGRDINAFLPDELQNTEEVVAVAGTRYKYINSRPEYHKDLKKSFLRVRLREVR